MRSYKDAKAMARSLRTVLAARNVPLSHSECLEIVAQQLGVADWNTLASQLSAQGRQPPPSPKANATRPMPRAAQLNLTAVPLVPLRDVVVFPGVLIPLFTARPKTIRAVEMATRGEKLVMLVTQRQLDVNEPAGEDLYQIGTIATVKGTESGPAAPWKVLVEGMTRARLDVLHAEDHLWAEASALNDIPSAGESDVLKKSVLDRFERLVRLREWPHKAWKTPPEPADLENLLRWFSSFGPGKFADAIAAHTPLSLAQKQQVLEMLDVRQRLEYVDAATRELEHGDLPSKR